MDESGMSLRAREVKTTTPLTNDEEKYKFGSACTWGRKQLQKLGVEYKQKANIKFKTLLRGEWGEVLQKRSSLFSIYLTAVGVEDGKEQLRSVNVSDLVSDIFAEDTIGDNAPKFEATFRGILSLIQNCRTNIDAMHPSLISDTTSNSLNTT
jgi:hypothetical protein